MKYGFSALIAFVALSYSAPAATIRLQQNDWNPAGTLDIVFTTNAGTTGAITQDELAAFSAVFVLPGLNTTSWTIGDIAPGGFLFTSADDFLFFFGHAEYSLAYSASADESLGIVLDVQRLFPVAASTARVTVVPEPATSTFLGLAWTALVLTQRRCSSSRSARPR
ncbi:MAG TPA: hypothetical protein VES20_03075 [Bryobacteraceae bacterium]|nr:hypothetical protein [Bryobacteraceae bacterium]